jgi:hypothetical protein
VKCPVQKGDLEGAMGPLKEAELIDRETGCNQKLAQSFA